MQRSQKILEMIFDKDICKLRKRYDFNKHLQ